MSGPGNTQELRPRLRAALTSAIKRRDRTATTALRSALAAIDNAETVNVSETANVGASRRARPVTRVGVGEVARRKLTAGQITAIVRAEVGDRHEAAAQYERLGRPERSAELRAEAAALAPHLETTEALCLPAVRAG